MFDVWMQSGRSANWAKSTCFVFVSLCFGWRNMYETNYISSLYFFILYFEIKKRDFYTQKKLYKCEWINEWKNYKVKKMKIYIFKKEETELVWREKKKKKERLIVGSNHWPIGVLSSQERKYNSRARCRLRQSALFGLKGLRYIHTYIDIIIFIYIFLLKLTFLTL